MERDILRQQREGTVEKNNYSFLLFLSIDSVEPWNREMGREKGIHQDEDKTPMSGSVEKRRLLPRL